MLEKYFTFVCIFIKQMKSNKSNIKSINSIIFKENKFSSEEEEGWCRVYVDLLEYKNSKTIWTVYFSHVYCDLLYEIGKALGMPYLFSFVPHDSVIDNIIFYGEKTKKIKNKELIIRQSAYLQYIVKTYENNNYDIFKSSSIHAIFAYDDIKIIEIVRNVIVEFLIKSSSLGISERVRIFIEITGEALKVKKENDFLTKEIIAIQKNAQKEYVFTVRSGNYKVIFGKLKDIDIKFKKLMAFYNKALVDKTIKKYKTINVKYHNQVVCTKQNQDGKQ